MSTLWAENHSEIFSWNFMQIYITMIRCSKHKDCKLHIHCKLHFSLCNLSIHGLVSVINEKKETITFNILIKMNTCTCINVDNIFGKTTVPSLWFYFWVMALACSKCSGGACCCACSPFILKIYNRVMIPWLLSKFCFCSDACERINGIWSKFAYALTLTRFR